MPFILAKQRDEDCSAAFERYSAYLEAERSRFPPFALELAMSDWYYSFGDHRVPHDAWLDSVTMSEIRGGSDDSPPTTSIRIRLLGAYHDGHIELSYSGVVACSMQSLNLRRGHGDWRYDEFRISESGKLIHEIEWWGMGATATWIIEASDVRHSWHPFEVAQPEDG